MKKTILILFTILFAHLMYGQSTVSDKSLSETPKLQNGLNPINPNPLYVVVVDSVNYKLENFGDYEIKPEWVESMEVFTDVNSKKVYGNDKGVVFIYIKEKYRKKALKEIEKKVGE
ncbi:MAG TPA: hypothetical protein VIN10_01090 [Bacteroidales bacterium]